MEILTRGRVPYPGMSQTDFTIFSSNTKISKILKSKFSTLSTFREIGLTLLVVIENNLNIIGRFKAAIMVQSSRADLLHRSRPILTFGRKRHAQLEASLHFIALNYEISRI